MCRRQRRTSRQRDTGRIGTASACQTTRSESSRFIRRIIDGVIAENQGKARHPGDLRVALFPSKYSRVRPPGPRAWESRHPLLEADNGAARPPTRRPTSKVNPFFGGSEDTLWPIRLPHPAHQIVLFPGAFASLIKTRIARLTHAGAARDRPNTHNRRLQDEEPAAQYHPNIPANSYSTCQGTAGEGQSRRSR